MVNLKEALGAAATAVGFVEFISILVFVYYILVVIANWKLFKKAGVAGWKSLIPIYNIYLLYRIAGMSGWSMMPQIIAIIISSIYYEAFEMPLWLAIAVLALSVIAFIINIVFAVKLPKAYGKGLLYTLGIIFFPNLFTIILGFSSAKYVGDYKA